MHLLPSPRSYAQPVDMGFLPPPATGSALLMHSVVGVGVMVNGLPEAPARTRSFPGFSHPQMCLDHDWLSPEVGHEPSLFLSKRCTNGYLWPKHSQTSNLLVIQRQGGRETQGRGEERAPVVFVPTGHFPWRSKTVYSHNIL